MAVQHNRVVHLSRARATANRSVRALRLGAAIAALSGAPAFAADPQPAPSVPPKATPKLEINVDVMLPRKLTPSWPKTVPEAKEEADAKNKPAETWAPDVIAAAKARCEVILKKISAVAIPEAPIKEGACGTPAPIQLISIGRKPEVAISPPATVTCEMAEALSQWIDNDLQPLARSHIGAEIIKIETMSSYSCRNAYGRAKNKLSEHGVANAIDIRGFVTASAQTAYVLEDWGKPNREVLAEIAAAKTAEEKANAIKAAAEKAAQTNQLATKAKAGPQPGTPPSATASNSGAPAAGLAHNTIIDGIPKITVTIPGARRDDDPATGLSLGEPNKLGGPKAAPRSVVRKADFLHAAHASACRIFGTTLGPEANEAHRNHLHIDMAARTTSNFCE